MQDFQTLTVYLGSSGHTKDVYRNAAERLGQLIGENEKRLVYGGMDAGLMGLAASAALESGAHVTGIIPKKLKDSERIHPALHETILVDDLWERKRKMFLEADVIVGLPGGFGTLDECLEVLYWGHLNRHNKPLALVDVEGYWSPLINYVRTLPDFDERFLLVADNVEGLFDALKAWKFNRVIAERKEDFPHFEELILDGSTGPIAFEEATVAETYHLITALGLKQLGKHQRPIGILNDKGQFDDLIKWFDNAESEKFITAKCRQLMSIETTPEKLRYELAGQKPVEIDLQNDKWGPGETETHIEVKEES